MEIQQTDEQLVIKAQNGDKQAEEKLFERYSNLVRYCARKFFLVGGDAEDLIQEGMMGLYQAIGDYKPSEEKGKRFKNFAYLCIWRRLVDAVKKASGRQHEPLKDYISLDEDWQLTGVNPEEAVILDDDRRELNTMMLRVLSDTEFKMFTMYMDGRTYAEICQLTGKSYKSVDNAIQRSKQKLRTALGQDERKGKGD